MLTWFYSLQLAYPWAFAVVGLSPLLILAYLKRSALRRRIVSSVIILQSLSKRPSRQRRFSPPLRFFLELLALFLLACAMTLPARGLPRNRVALLVDNSLSMRAAAAGSGTQTRFAQATQAVKDWSKNESTTSAYTVFTSSPKLNRVGEERLSLSDAVEAVQTVEPTLTADALEAGIKELAESGDYDRIAIFSDRQIQFDDDSAARAPRESDATKGSSFGKLTTIEAVESGKRISNFYISGINISHSGVDQAGTKINVTVGYSGPRPADLSAVLYRAEQPQAELHVIARTPVKAVPDRLVEASFNVTEQSGAGSIFKVQLESPVADIDALKEDDSAWVSASSVSGSSLLLVTPSDQLETKLGLANIPGMRVTAMSPTDYAKLEPRELDKFALLVFHRTAPTVAPRRPSLLLLPPANNPLFSTASEVVDPRITSWEGEHPITSYLKVPLLKFNAALLIDVPLWGEPVINIEQGCVLASGESQGVRLAAVGFELLPFEGAKSPALSILTLNLLNWLSGGGELSNTTLTDTAVRLESDRVWTVIGPDGKSSEVSGPVGETKFLTLAQPGVYQITGGDTGSSAAEQRVLTANVFYPEESSTFTKSVLQTAKTYYQERELQDDSEPLWPKLIAVATALIVIELLLSLFTRSIAAEERR